MKSLFAILTILALGALPALAEIVTVNPTPAPCSGNHCVNMVRGARVEHHGAASIQKSACPAGTIYNPRKGTCRVLGPN